MVDVTTLKLGMLETNCYILKAASTSEVVIVDAPDQPDVIEAYLTKKSLIPKAILITHSHFDHIGALQSLNSKYSLSIYMSGATPNQSFAIPYIAVEDNDIIETAAMKIKVIATPGHSPDSVCYLVEDHLLGDYLFSGDTLFKQTAGRTDLEGGSLTQLMQSLELLKQLPGTNYLIYPGHMDSTSMVYEKQHNEFLR